MDYNEIFSLVVKYTSIITLLAIVVHYDMYLKQIDVKINFLHDELEERILMK